MLSNLATRDVETLLHPYTNLSTHRQAGPLVLERGEGVHVYDTEGRPYIEGMSGLWCTALGYSNAELVEAARAQMARLPFTHLFSGRSHDPGIEANHADWDLPLPGFLHVAPAHHYRGAGPGETEEAYSARLAAELEETI